MRWHRHAHFETHSCRTLRPVTYALTFLSSHSHMNMYTDWYKDHGSDCIFTTVLIFMELKSDLKQKGSIKHEVKNLSGKISMHKYFHLVPSMFFKSSIHSTFHGNKIFIYSKIYWNNKNTRAVLMKIYEWN